jgi:hypothetical protein
MFVSIKDVVGTVCQHTLSATGQQHEFTELVVKTQPVLIRTVEQRSFVHHHTVVLLLINTVKSSLHQHGVQAREHAFVWVQSYGGRNAGGQSCLLGSQSTRSMRHPERTDAGSRGRGKLRGHPHGGPKSGWVCDVLGQQRIRRM